ncbi:MAG: hypothetical protein PHV49_04110, partial [Alistipes sp.]|nr:hypothetical protein [Alistipes sp.]
IGSFYIDREHRFVGVYDVLKKQIFRYAFDGTLLAQKPVPPEMNYIRDLIKVSEDQLIVTFSNSAEYPFNYGVFDPEEYTFLHYAIPYTVIGTESSTNWMPSIARNDHSYLAATALSDTLYSGASQTPEVLLQTGRKATSPAQIATWGPFARGLEAWNEALKRGYSGGVTQLWMTEKYGCLRTDQFAHTASFSLNGVEQELTGTYPCYLIWALRESDHPSVSFIPRSMNLFYPGMSPFVGATEDALVGIIPAYRIAGLRETELPSEDKIYLYPPIKHLIETIQEDDNPVLVFYPISAL